MVKFRETLHRPDFKLQTQEGTKANNQAQCVRVTDVFTVASKEVSSGFESTAHA